MLLAISLLFLLPSRGMTSSTHRDTRYLDGGTVQPSATQHYGAQTYAGGGGGGYGFQQDPQQSQEVISPDKLPALGGVSFAQPTSFEFDHRVSHVGGINLGGAGKGQAASGQQSYYAPPATEGYGPQATGNVYGRTPAEGYGSGEQYGGGDYPSGSYRHRTTSWPHQGDRRYPQGTDMHYSYGSEQEPKRYNNEHAYSYEKVYPEQRYSHNHAVSYQKNFGDNAPKGYESHQESRTPSSYGESYGRQPYGPQKAYGPPPRSYGPQHYDGQSSGSHGQPRVRSYVYRDPYDKSTTKVVAMHRGTPAPSTNMPDKNGSMDGFIEEIMRRSRGEYQ